MRRHVIRRGLFASRSRRRGDFMPAAGGLAALIDGTAQALTARRRIRKRDMSGGGCLFKDRDRAYIRKMLRIARCLDPYLPTTIYFTIHPPSP